MEHVRGGGSWKSTAENGPCRYLSSWRSASSHQGRFERWPCRRGALKIPPGHRTLFGPVNLSQHPPCANQLLNGGGWREHFADVCAISVGRLVNALDAGDAQHGQGRVGEECR